MIDLFIEWLEYRKHPRTYCRNPYGNEFTVWNDAREQCSREYDCNGIYNKGCDLGSSYLCYIEFGYEYDKGTNDCFWEKGRGT